MRIGQGRLPVQQDTHVVLKFIEIDGLLDNDGTAYDQHIFNQCGAKCGANG